MIKEVVAIQTEKTEVLKPEPYIVEKIIVTNEVQQEAVPVHVERAVVCRKDVPIAVERSIAVPVIREVPKELIREKVVEVRSIIENNREVPVQVEKVVTIESVRPEVIQTSQQILKVVV